MHTHKAASLLAAALAGAAGHAVAQSRDAAAAVEPPGMRAPDAPAPAPAPDLAPPLRPMYFGISAGVAEFKANLGEADEFDTADFAGSYRVGWRFRPHLALEGIFQSFGYLNAVFSAAFDDGTDLLPIGHYGVALVGDVPLLGPLSAFAKAGVGSTFFSTPVKSDRKRNVTEPTVGAGLTLGPLWRLDFRLEVVRFMHSEITARQFITEVRF